ncbi:hypothetical protein ABBQ38_002996 [Trebouxia sp. C0009 RCD-2024]
MFPHNALTVRTKWEVAIAPQPATNREKSHDELQARRQAIRARAQQNFATAVSPRTGRVAAGPWEGPYESSSNAVCGSPIYLDGAGSGHFDLDAHEEPESPSTPAATVHEMPL